MYFLYQPIYTKLIVNGGGQWREAPKVVVLITSGVGDTRDDEVSDNQFSLYDLTWKVVELNRI